MVDGEDAEVKGVVVREESSRQSKTEVERKHKHFSLLRICI